MPDNPRYCLSPYCVLHADPHGQTVTLHHALYGSRFTLAADLLPVIGALHAGTRPESVLASLPQEAQQAIRVLVEERALVAEGDGDGLSDPALFRHRLTPVELAVQRGFNEGGYVPGQLDPTGAPPRTKEIPGAPVVPLATHPVTPANLDLPTCLARRRSVRAYDERPLARHDLELFLQLATRDRAARESPPSDRPPSRVHPSAGALYPLEIYPVLYAVDGIDAGLYHYRPVDHALAALASDPAHRDALREWARHKMAVRSTVGPQVLFLVTAVFGRTCWKYTGMAYQAILMETGALYQTMYLVATALGLGPCAVGAFPERATAELLGVDSRDESQVGMFALGVPEPPHAS
jgi:SagB-type dehydrogenase family enzyme